MPHRPFTCNEWFFLKLNSFTDTTQSHTLLCSHPTGWNQGAEDQEPATQRLRRLHVPGVRSQRVQHWRQVRHLQAHKCHKCVSSPDSLSADARLLKMPLCVHACMATFLLWPFVPPSFVPSDLPLLLGLFVNKLKGFFTPSLFLNNSTAAKEISVFSLPILLPLPSPPLLPAALLAFHSDALTSESRRGLIIPLSCFLYGLRFHDSSEAAVALGFRRFRSIVCVHETRTILSRLTFLMLHLHI